MKFRVTFKTPYVLDMTLEDHKETHCLEHARHVPACEECVEAEDRSFNNLDAIQKCAEKFIQYGEYITIEFDTETQTATAVPLK